MISWRNSRAAGSSTNSPDSSPKTCLRTMSRVTIPQLGRAGSSTTQKIWKKAPRRGWQRFPQTYILVHCLGYYKTKHIWGFFLVGLQKRCVMTTLSECKMKFKIKRQRINIHAQPSSLLWHRSHCVTFVDLTRLWPETQTPKQQCLLNSCLLSALSQRPLT